MKWGSTAKKIQGQTWIVLKNAQYREYFVLDDISMTYKGKPWIGVITRVVFILYWTWHADLSPIQGELYIGMIYHHIGKNIKWPMPCLGKHCDAQYKVHLDLVIGRKPVENILNFTNTWYFRFFCYVM